MPHALGHRASRGPVQPTATKVTVDGAFVRFVGTKARVSAAHVDCNDDVIAAAVSLVPTATPVWLSGWRRGKLLARVGAGEGVAPLHSLRSLRLLFDGSGGW